MKRAGIVTIALLMAVSYLAAVPANAIPSDDAIRAACVPVKSALSQTEKNDAALRINRGRIYMEISDLLYAMNARLNNNKHSAPKLSQITEDFVTELDLFRSNYSKYDDGLVELTTLNCGKDPSGFYTKLQEVRQKREGLRDNVTKLDQLLADYQTEWNVVKEDLGD